MRRIQRPEFTSISGDTALENQDPHAIGVAIKASAREAAAEPMLMGRKAVRKASTAKGFGR